MESLDSRSAPPLDPGDPALQASLHLELRVPDERMVAAFRQEFLRWLNDRSSPFARMMGAAASLSLNELPTGAEPRGLSSLRLTVTWTVPDAHSIGAGATPRGTAFAGLPTARQPAPATLRRPLQIDEFVFFPEPVQSSAPLFPAWSLQLISPDAGARKSAPHPRIERPVTVAMVRQTGQMLQAVRAWAGKRTEGLAARGASPAAFDERCIPAPPHRATYARRGPRAAGAAPPSNTGAILARRALAVGRIARLAATRHLRHGLLGINGLIIRLPSIARYPRAWGAGAIAAAAVATGFAAGSIYLSSAPPAVEALATSTAALAAPPIPSPRGAISSPGAPPELAVAPVGGEALPAAPARLDSAMATSAPLDIPDAEVTTRRQMAVPPGLPRRPAAVVARAAKVTAVSGAPAEQRRIKGALLVKSEPQGAEVSINGIVHGRTPLVISELGVGSRVVRLDLPGYQRWSWAVSVVANRRTPVTVKLQPEGR